MLPLLKSNRVKTKLLIKVVFFKTVFFNTQQHVKLSLLKGQIIQLQINNLTNS